MILVKLNESDFEYDLHSLIKAFYPEEEVIIDQDPISRMKKKIREQRQHELRKSGLSKSEAAKKAASQANNLPLISLFIEVYYKEDSIVISFKEEGRLLQKESIDVNYVNHEAAEERKDTKNRLKKLLYQMFSKQTGKELLWGTLNGIRPTKIPMAALEEGIPKDKILHDMKETYLISDEKGRMCIDIAQQEKCLMDLLDVKDGYSLYIGIPFCPTKCLYCSFTSYPIAKWESQVGAYLDALRKEMDFVSQAYAGRKLQTIYIGGGTPTSLNAYQLQTLLHMIEARFDLNELVEFTVEGGRPDSLTREKLQVLYDSPVTRISVNPQTMNQRTLDLIGRSHTVEETKEAFLLAREIGFDNINMDIILGLPGEGEEELQYTLSEIQKLMPDSLTVHSLALKRAARLTDEYDKYQKIGMHNSDEYMDTAREAAANMGLFPYYMYRQKNMAGNLENVGYSRPGKEGIYNILIMEEKQTILSLGAGGMTKFVTGSRPIRVENVKDVANYINRVDEMIERKKEVINGIK
jgi:coproporphyrinogen dehydrogenase HemZ